MTLFFSRANTIVSFPLLPSSSIRRAPQVHNSINPPLPVRFISPHYCLCFAHIISSLFSLLTRNTTSTNALLSSFEEHDTIRAPHANIIAPPDPPSQESTATPPNPSNTLQFLMPTSTKATYRLHLHALKAELTTTMEDVRWG
jgi:hypothetical protein